GTATTCACDERTAPALCQAPTLHGSIIISSASGATLPTGGGTFTFSVTGGTQTSYTLRSNPGGVVLNPTTVIFPTSFTLTTTASQNGLTIILIATDTVTGQSGTITLTQSP